MVLPGVRRYVADPHLGGPVALAAARAELAHRELRLGLDYVPNHVAPDHPAVAEHPEWSVAGTARALAEAPDSWLDIGVRVFAYGRDPCFPPWPDVVQLDAFRPEVRQATADVLGDILDQCDAARCNMVMLLVNDVFTKRGGGTRGRRRPRSSGRSSSDSCGTRTRTPCSSPCTSVPIPATSGA